MIEDGYFDSVYGGNPLFIRGGTFGDDIATPHAIIYGTDFRINGAPIPGLDQPGDSQIFEPIKIGTRHFAGAVESDSHPIPRRVFTGLLQNQTAFAFDSREREYSATLVWEHVFFTNLSIRTLELCVVEVDSWQPTATQASGLVSQQTTLPGQKITLNAGGILPRNHVVYGGELYLNEGSQAAQGLQLIDAYAELNGGEIWEFLDLYANSHLVMNSGVLRRSVDVTHGSHLELRGGQAWDGIRASIGGKVTVDGGQVDLLEQTPGGTIHVKSGVVHRLRQEFFAGFGFDTQRFDLNRIHSQEPSSIIIDGGSVGRVDLFMPTNITLAGGTLGLSHTAVPFYHEDEVRIAVSGGTLRSSSDHALDSVITQISGGRLAPLSSSSDDLAFGLETHISGGGFDVNMIFDAETYARRYAATGRTPDLTLYGSEFKLDDQPIPGLVVGEPHDVQQRNQQLTALLADDTPFILDLYSERLDGQDYVDPRSSIRLILMPQITGDYNNNGQLDDEDLTLLLTNENDRNLFFDADGDAWVTREEDLAFWVEELFSSKLGDFDLSGTVNMQDLSLLALNFGLNHSATYQQGDANSDGSIDLIDLSLLASNFGFTRSVPEPALAASLLALLLVRQRSMNRLKVD
ncbi:hypothetical protein [Mucisphaera sp.]|uniref:hypothetical protein n=1 Tax=Mucisphaera sp. TaxID=2913024 RepID=UPI003D118E8F